MIGIRKRFLLGTGRLPQVKGHHTPTNPCMLRELRNLLRPKSLSPFLEFYTFKIASALTLLSPDASSLQQTIGNCQSFSFCRVKGEQQ
jgi:hypothetical protein